MAFPLFLTLALLPLSHALNTITSTGHVLVVVTEKDGTRKKVFLVDEVEFDNESEYYFVVAMSTGGAFLGRSQAFDSNQTRISVDIDKSFIPSSFHVHVCPSNSTTFMEGACALSAVPYTTAAVGEQMIAAVAVEDQEVVKRDGKVFVTIARVISPGTGFLVVHPCTCGEECSVQFAGGMLNGGHGFGTGFTPLHHGRNENVEVEIGITDTKPTGTMYAMLHFDRLPLDIYTANPVDYPIDNSRGSLLNPAFNITDAAPLTAFYDDLCLPETPAGTPA